MVHFGALLVFCLSFMHMCQAMLLSDCLTFLPWCGASYESAELNNSHIRSCDGHAPLWHQIWWVNIQEPDKVIGVFFKNECLSIAYSRGTVQTHFLSCQTADSFFDYHINVEGFIFKQYIGGGLFCSIQKSFMVPRVGGKPVCFAFDGMGYTLSSGEILMVTSEKIASIVISDEHKPIVVQENITLKPINPRTLIYCAGLNQLVVAGEEQGILVCDKNESSWVFVGKEHHYIKLIKFKLGNQFIGITDKGEVFLWRYLEAWQGDFLFTIPLTSNIIVLVGSEYLIVAQENFFHVYDVNSRERVACYSTYTSGRITDLVVSSDDQYLATVTDSKRVRLWFRGDRMIVPYSPLGID